MIATAVMTMVLAAGAAGPEDVLARVDGVAITRAEVAERLRVLHEAQPKAGAIQALDALVDEAVLAAQARRDGLDSDPEIRVLLDAQRRKLLANAAVAEVVDRATVSEDLLRKLFHASGDTARLVLVKLESREDAAAALARVVAGGDLSAEARRQLDAGLAARGGDTGTVIRGELDPALGEEVFRAPIGGLVGPLQLRLGWAIARVVARTVGTDADFQARRTELEAFARKQIAAQTRRHLAEKLRAKSGVTIDEAFLSSLPKGTAPTPEQLDHVIATVNGKPLRYRAVYPSLAQVASTGGHLAGPSVKISFAQALVEEALLAEAALERGLDASPALKGLLPGLDRAVLAQALADRVARAKGSAAPDVKIRKRIRELRPRAKVEIDEAKLASVGAVRG